MKKAPAEGWIGFRGFRGGVCGGWRDGDDTGGNGGKDDAADALVQAMEEGAVDVRICGVEVFELGTGRGFLWCRRGRLGSRL